MKNLIHIIQMVAFAAGVALSFPMSAAVVGPNGYTETFELRPPATNWVTSTVGTTTSAGDVYDLTELVQSRSAAQYISQLLDASTAGEPPSPRPAAFWTSGGSRYICTRPNNNRCTFLMVKLLNVSGTNATGVRISYDLTVKAPVVEPDYPGLRAFYSLTGQSNSWVAIPEFSSATPVDGSLSVELSFATPWMHTNLLYVLWADDNANTAELEPGYALDNFFAAVTGGTPIPTGLECAVSAPAPNTALVSTAPVTITANVIRGTPPYSVEFFTNSGVGNLEFTSAGIDTNAPYTNWLGLLPVGSYNVYIVATDSAAEPATVVSLTNAFSVADPIQVALTAPAPEATFDYTVAVAASATVAGGTPPYTVQFYLDNVAQGLALTAAPYDFNYGLLAPGNHVLRVTARDASGWVSNSVNQTVHIIGPLGVSLTPTNGAAFNYGQSLVLTAAVAYGVAPQTVTFYTNEQVAAVLSAPPYVTNLGVVPVGSYTCYAQAVDSTVPTPQQAFSTTNVISIVENPLLVSLTSPLDGQKASQGSDVLAAASVGAPLTIANVEFFLDGASLGVDNAAPYLASLGNASLGQHGIYVVATDSLGRKSTTATNQVTVIIPTGGLVGPGGYFNSFDSQPPASDWATSSRSGGAADNYSMDTEVNASITASSVTARPVANTGNPPSANANALWSSTGYYLQTRPTGNRYTMLMGKFTNDSGTNATEIGISYLFTIAAGGSSEDAGLGTRVYYSLTGQTNSWTNLVTFNTTASANGSNIVSTNLSLIWTNGAALYLLWADDNAGASGGMATDPANQIDDFSLQVTAGLPPFFACTVESPTNGAVLVSGAPITATATVVYGVEPYSVEYFVSSGAGNLEFHSVGTSATHPYEVNLGSFAAGIYNIYAVATDSSGTPVSTNSVTNTFVVADPISVALTAPAPDATFDYLASVEATAAVAGGIPPYSVQFSLDGVPFGAPVTAAPYSINFGTLFVGDHAIQATATDATGWVSNSVAHTVHITGPLAVMLLPANGTAYNYGQPLVLTAPAGGGTGPYSVAFFVNDQPAGTLIAPPFTVDLGVLPVGTYNCYVQATDSSTPAVQQAVSSTNLITILENPLLATLTSPTNGQSAATNLGFTATVSVDVAAPVTVSRVEFFLDGASMGVDEAAPYSLRIYPATLGAHYVHAVATDSLGRQSATATIAITAVHDPLANDNFVNRLTLTGASANVTGANVGASTEPGEPTGSGFTRWGATLWYTWTAPVNGTVRIDTFGSDFNTSLGVYTGTAVNSLNQVVFNDNASGMANVSLVTFNAQQGTTYQIQVGGIQGFFGGTPATGSYLLNLQMPPSVRITSPTNGSFFLAGSSFEIAATASSPHGPVTNVAFYSGSLFLGSDDTEPYSIIASDVPAGTNRLVAVVQDNIGMTATSAVVSVLVANVGVTIISPADGAIYQNTNAITVSAFTLVPSGAITNVEFLVDGVMFGEDASSPFSAVWRTVTGGSHRLTAIGKDDQGKTYVSAPVNIAVAQTLLARGSVWKYLDNGSDQGTAWRATDFDDSTWAGGPAELGYGDGDEATVVNGGPEDNYYITTYFRSTFVVRNLAGFSSIVMNVKRDDGAVVYLNGVEAARYNMPSGEINYLTTTGNASDDGADFNAATVPTSLLVEGTNVIAVEIHQSGSTSSDVSFNMDVLGIPYVIRNQYPTVALTNPTDGSFALAPASLTLSAEASDADGEVTRVEFYVNDVKLGESTNSPYVLQLVDVPAGVYVMTAVATDDQDGSQSSAPVTVTVYEPSSRWVAFNDHVAGPGTHPNATAWNAFGTDDGAPGDEGALRSIATGAPVAANLTILEFGAFGDVASGAPLPETPAYATFNGFVDFGTGDANHAILVTEDSLVMHLFTGLNPNRRYSFRGTAMGGVASYANRWTLFAVVGADSFTAAHTANVLTSATLADLAPEEAAMNTGDNRSGDVVGWDNIAPGADGSFLIVSSQYLGPAPGNAQPGPMAYAPVAVRLEELSDTPWVQITAPRDGYVVQGPTNAVINAFASSVSAVANVHFLADGVVLGSATEAPYSFDWADVPFGTHVLTAVACDTLGVCGTSAPVTITITIPPTNTVAPTIFSQIPEADSTVTNLTSIQVTFSEPVSGVDAADLLINGVPATKVTGSGSNYTFTVTQPPYGPVTVSWAENHGIVDGGWPERLPFDRNDPTAVWEYVLIDRTPPVVAARNPAANATVTNLTSVSVTFSEPVAGVNASDFLVNNTPAYEVMGSGTNYTFSFAQPASGTVNISWAANHGITDVASSRNAFNATGPGATWTYTLDAKTILIQSNALWFFVKGTNEASEPINAWRQLAFDDSGWSNAPAPFFYGDPYSNGVPAYTLLSDMRSNYTSIYLRKTVVLGKVDTITNLYLRFIIDDGMVVWINGTEVLRTNVPAGELYYTNTASTAYQENGGMPYVTLPLPDPRGYLVTGTNIITVHALNDSLTTSSDFGFNAQLYTYQADTEVVPPRIVRRDPAAGYELELTEITVTFSEPVTGVDAADLLVNGVPATGLASTTNTVYTFTFPQPAYGAVAVTWAANHGIVDLDLEPKSFDATAANAVWEYILLNPNSPYLDSVTPAQDTTVTTLTAITVVFSEPMTGVDAGDLLINGTPAAGLLGTGNTYTFAFPQPAYGTIAVTWSTNHGMKDLAEPPNEFEPEWPGHTWTYLLVDQIPPAVAAQDPPANAFVTNLTQLTVTFTEPVSGVNAGDLLLNGVAATGLTGSGTTYTFTFAQPNASVINVTWTALHGIRDQATTPNAFDATAPGATWTYATVDNLPPKLVSVIPAPFSTVRTLRQVTLAFDEPVAGLTAGSLTLNGAAAQAVAGFGAGPYQFTFDQPATGTVQVALSAAIFDLATPPNQYAGSNWTVVLNPDLPPAPLTRGPYLQIPTSSSIVIRWRTATNTDSCVWFGPDADSRTNIVADAALTTEHVITVTNLEPATKYYYAVGTTDGGKFASTSYHFTTDPPIGTVRPVRIFALTDWGTRDNNERTMREAYLNYAANHGAADVWLSCGDNDQTDGSDNNYSTSVFGATYGYSNLLQNLALRPTPGNHDYGNSSNTGATYYATFSMPANGEGGGVPSGSENYYSYDYANIHFISMDAITQRFSSSTNSDMIQWLHRDLASNTQRWTIAYWHGPAYSRGTHDSDSTTDTLSWMTQMRENVVPVLEAYGVDLVLNGHCHLHERTWLLNGHYGYSSTFSETNKVDAGNGREDGDGAYLKPVGQKAGTVYVVVPSGGQPRSSSTAQHPATLMRLQNVLGGGIIDVDNNRLDFRMLGAYSPYTDFQILDHFTIIKDAPVVPPTAPTDLIAVQNANGVLLSWQNAPTNEMGYRIIRSLDGLTWLEITSIGANRTSYTDTTLPSGATGFYRIAAWNDAGNSRYSDVAAVGATGAPLIVEQPENVTAGVGGTATFHVVAAGAAPLSYQWYFNWSEPIAGATNSTLHLSGILNRDMGIYTVLITNAAGSVTSADAALTVEGVESVWLNISQSANVVEVSWFAEAVGYDLQHSQTVGPSAQWQTINEGISVEGDLNVFRFQSSPSMPAGFFRLQKR